jgi:acyl-CoA synthetase (AMP-forming)/AMP-acid ligase II
MGQVQQLLSRRTNEDSQRVAFIHGQAGTAITWGDIAAQSAHWLVHLAGHADERPLLVGIALGNPTTFCSTYLAALANGTPIAPLDPRATADELAERASILALTDVVGDRLESAQVGALTDAGARVWTLGNRGLQLVAESPEPWTLSVDAHAPSVVLATSGSTGRPKLVPLTEDQLVRAATEVATHHRLRSIDRGYCPLPLFHINAQVVGVLAALVSGASLIVEERFAKDRFWDIAHELEATWLNLVPAILATLTAIGAPSTSTERLRFARSASSPLSDAVRARFESVSGVGILETYGMTEAASQITANPLRPEDRRIGSVGLPVGVDVRVVDGSGTPAPPEVTGVVQIRGATVVDHYLAPGRIDATSACDREGWLTTGDLGRRDVDGFLYLAGRADDVINRGGEKVYPREIEEVLLRDARVHEAVATGRPHPALGSQPVAFVTTSLPADDRAQLATDLAQSCAEALSRYKRPAEIFVTDALPVGATGKVSRRHLGQLFELSGVDS